MRWRRNQTNTGFGITQLRNHVVDLMARQLSALTGLRTLCDLDLDDLGVHKILSGHSESPGSDLLDLGHALSAIARRIFTTFTRVGTSSDTVHRYCQRFMCLGR